MLVDSLHYLVVVELKISYDQVAIVIGNMPPVRMELSKSMISVVLINKL